MKRLLIFVVKDFKHIFRDKLLSFFLFAPIILGLFVHFIVPFLLEKYPILGTYQHFILMFAAMQTAIMMGFVTAFIMLEEKDENVLDVLRIMPFSTNFFLLYRLLFGAIFSFIGALGILNLTAVSGPGFGNSLVLALQFALVGPLISMAVASLAQNKIEGMAYFKGIDLVFVLPILSFFVPTVFKYLFSPIPVFWTFQLYEAMRTGGPIWFYFGLGCLVYIVALTFMVKLYQRRVFARL